MNRPAPGSLTPIFDVLQRARVEEDEARAAVAARDNDDGQDTSGDSKKLVLGEKKIYIVELSLVPGEAGDVRGVQLFSSPNLASPVLGVFLDPGTKVAGQKVISSEPENLKDAWLQLGAERYLPGSSVALWDRNLEQQRNLSTDARLGLPAGTANPNLQFDALLARLHVFSMSAGEGGDSNGSSASETAMGAMNSHSPVAAGSSFDEAYCSAKALFRDDIELARIRNLWGHSTTEIPFCPSECVAFAIRILRLDPASSEQRKAQKVLVARLLGNPRMWWDEQNPRHPLLQLLKRACMQKIKEMKGEASNTSAAGNTQSGDNLDAQAGADFLPSDATVGTHLPTIAEDSVEMGVQHSAPLTPEPMTRPTSSRVLSVASPSTPSSIPTPSHMHSRVFQQCWHGRFGGSYRENIFIALLLLLGSIARQEVVAQLEELIETRSLSATMPAPFAPPVTSTLAVERFDDESKTTSQNHTQSDQPPWGRRRLSGVSRGNISHGNHGTGARLPLPASQVREYSPGGSFRGVRRSGGGFLKVAALKSFERIRIKMEKYVTSPDWHPRAASVLDVVRGTVVLSSEADMNNFLARLHNEPNLKVLRCKNRLGKVECGKTGIPHLLLNIQWTAKPDQTGNTPTWGDFFKRPATFDLFSEVERIQPDVRQNRVYIEEWLRQAQVQAQPADFIFELQLIKEEADDHLLYEIARANSPHALCKDIYKKPPDDGVVSRDAFKCLPPTLSGPLLESPFGGASNESCVGLIMRPATNMGRRPTSGAPEDICFETDALLHRGVQRRENGSLIETVPEDANGSSRQSSEGEVFLPVILNRQHGERNWEAIQLALRKIVCKSPRGNANQGIFGVILSAMKGQLLRLATAERDLGPVTQEECEGALQLYCYLLHMLLFAAHKEQIQSEASGGGGGGSDGGQQSRKSRSHANGFLPKKLMNAFHNLNRSTSLPADLSHLLNCLPLIPEVTFRQIREKFIAIAMYRNCYWAQTKSGKGQLLLRSLMHENRFPVPAWTEPRGRPDVHVGHCSTSINNAEHGSTHMNMSDTISGSSPASDRLNCSNVPTPCTPDGSELQQRTLVTGRKAREQAASEFVQNFLEVSVISKRLIALGVCMHDVTESWLKNAKVTPRQPAPHASLRRSADDTSSAVFVGHIPFAKPLPESPVAVYNTGSDPRALLRLYDSTLGRMRFEDRQLVQKLHNRILSKRTFSFDAYIGFVAPEYIDDERYSAPTIAAWLKRLFQGKCGHCIRCKDGPLRTPQRKPCSNVWHSPPHPGVHSKYYHLEPLLNEKKFERSSDVARKRRAKKEINAEWGTVSPHLHFDVRALNWCFWCQKHVVTVYVETTPPAPHRGKWRAGTRRDNHRPDNASRGKRDIPDINDIFFKVRQTLLSLVPYGLGPVHGVCAKSQHGVEVAIYAEYKPLFRRANEIFKRFNVQGLKLKTTVASQFPHRCGMRYWCPNDLLSVRVWENRGTLDQPSSTSRSRAHSGQARHSSESGRKHFRNSGGGSACRSGRGEVKLKRPASAQAGRSVPVTSSPTQLLQTLQLLWIEKRHSKAELTPIAAKKCLMQLTASCKEPGALPLSAREQTTVAFAAAHWNVREETPLLLPDGQKAPPPTRTELLTLIKTLVELCEDLR